MQEETTEDIHRLGGVDEEEKVDGSLRDSIKSRLPWLIVNLITAILAASVVGAFEGTISQVVTLATFIAYCSRNGWKCRNSILNNSSSWDCIEVN